MTGKLIAFPFDVSETTSHTTADDRSSHELPTITRARPVRASLASELRPLRRARTERDDGAVGELVSSRKSAPMPARGPSGELSSRPRPSAIVPIARTADHGRELSGEIDTAARRDPPTMGERIRAESPRTLGPLRELDASASPPEPDARHARKPAIRVLVGGRVKYVGWV